MATRREFLKNLGALSLCSATGTASLLMSLCARAADTSGYKALVCVFLYGGMDNYDTVIPYDQVSYDRYAQLRQSLLGAYGGSRERPRLLPLNPANAGQFGSRRFALPPELGPLHTLFESGKAAIIGNVGPLMEPITRTEFENNKDRLPMRLFSHNDQQSTWMSLRPEGGKFGWGGRFLDAQIASNANVNAVFSAISVDGNAVLLSGDLARPYQIGIDGVPAIDVLTGYDLKEDLSNNAYELLREHLGSRNVDASHVLVRDIAAKHGRFFDANALFNTLAGDAPAISTVFPDSGVGERLEAVAKTLSVRNELGANRQVFFVGMGGFDTHGAQAADLPALQHELGEAVAAFHAATQELGVEQDVTLFTASEFGRSLAVNGDGTDHGWGAHHFAVGGATLGGSIYGAIPPCDYGHDYDAGHGRLIPAVSVQQYAASLGRWFGLSNSELLSALPGLENFPPFDFMAA